MGRISEAAIEGRYPNEPGWKARDTSREAAKSIGHKSKNLREKVLAQVIAAGANGLTADEAGDRIGVGPLVARPRMTELSARGYVKPSLDQRRRPSSTGKSSIVWIATPEGKAHAEA